jgi:putative ATP-dependent endonuclease of the OLD family
MFLERVIITNFRCFGRQAETIMFAQDVTAFVGSNGAGKTAVMQALLRLFGVTSDQRRIRRQDFHVPAGETTPAVERSLCIEAILAFPELDDESARSMDAVPEFFHQMAADENGKLKCRLRLEATWIDDGSLEGAIEQKFWAVRTLAAQFEEAECSEIKPSDRSRVQMIYVPAVRDGAAQVTAFLKGRLWRTITWSDAIRTTLSDSGQTLNQTFMAEPAVEVIATAVTRRWREVYSGGTDTTPAFRPIDLRLQEFIRKVDVVFSPDEAGRERGLEELSDGQRSLFHLALTAATIDVERAIVNRTTGTAFQRDAVALPALTLIAIEEPENNLAPFYLSRIVRQIENLTTSSRAQALISSHSASILARIEPEQVRHFRLVLPTRTTQVREIRLPPDTEEASKFVREAVRTYPEMYFARFVVLGEGSSEEIVVPRLAEAMNFPIDRSFVALVPLGGRHVNHLWKLLTDLDIPHATLLDLDAGRAGGAFGRIKTVCRQLIDNGVAPTDLFAPSAMSHGVEAALRSFDNAAIKFNRIKGWIDRLRDFGIFFCSPLDLDWSMLNAFPEAYRTLDQGMSGPSGSGDAKSAVLGDQGNPAIYDGSFDEQFRWYRYLFLGRGKPSTHVRVLGMLNDETLRSRAPQDIVALIEHVSKVLFGEPSADTDS